MNYADYCLLTLHLFWALSSPYHIYFLCWKIIFLDRNNGLETEGNKTLTDSEVERCDHSKLTAFHYA